VQCDRSGLQILIIELPLVVEPAKPLDLTAEPAGAPGMKTDAIRTENIT